MEKQNLKRGIAILAGLFALAALVAGSGYVKITRYLTTPADPHGLEQVFIITPGQGLRQVAAGLKNQGLITDSLMFTVYARYKDAASRLKAGEYLLSPGQTPDQILSRLLAGKVRLYRITIPEGLNMDEVAAVVESAGFCKKDRFLRRCQDPEFMGDLKVPSHTLEGFLFPDTYFFPKATPCDAIIQKMVATFSDVYTPEWRERTKALGFTLQEIVTLASMIEKETGDASERPLISSVFHNRLRKRMRLESDPTVVYGDPDFTGRIRTRHLRRKTPYNTYQMYGLPKGPIANPGAKALEAALYPAESDFLFFVSKNDTTHYFSKTLREHNRAVRKYQLNR